jgi:hypothetical protein
MTPLARIAITLICLIGKAHPSPFAQNGVESGNLIGCQREIKKLGPIPWGEKIRSPWRTRRVSPAYPAIPDGTSGGGIWIGEILIDAQGRASRVWTIREVKLSPPLPSLNTAITDAVAKWEFAPAAVDGVPVPACQTVAVKVNLDVIRKDRQRRP